MSSWTPDRSEILSLLLNEVTGTQEAIYIRQDHCLLHDSMLSSTKLSNIYYTGSKAEGLDLPGSDMDFMIDMNSLLNIGKFNMFHFNVIQSLQERSNTALCEEFLLCTEDTKPGFALLRRVMPPKISGKLNPFLQKGIQNINGVQYLIGDRMIDMLHSNYDFMTPYVTRKRPGPSLEKWMHWEDKSESGTDGVYSIHCDFWPKDALEWAERPRHFGWPSSRDISSIIDFGCHLVSIGHPNSETKFMEWRVSFSIAERILVWSFNHIQIQCYAVMKIILKEFIKKKCRQQNQVLCSYFIKTFLFWKYETTNLDFWCKSNFRECIKFLLTEFSQCIQEGVLRHYFLPSFNLLSVKLTQEAQTELLQLFDIINQCDISIFKECSTLQKVWSKFLLANENQMKIIQNERKTNFLNNDVLLMEKFNTLLMLPFDKEDLRSNFSIFSNDQNIQKIVSYFAKNNEFGNKDLQNYWITQGINAFKRDAPITWQRPISEQIISKVLSLPCKTCLKSLLIDRLTLERRVRSLLPLSLGNEDLYKLQEIANGNTSSEILSKLWCAIVFLKKSDYTSTLDIINQVLSNISPFVLYYSARDSHRRNNQYLDRFFKSSCTTTQRAKQAWLTDIMFADCMSDILPLGIQIELYFRDHEHNDQNRVYLSPYICAHYLLFLCYNEIHQYDNRDCALRQLIDNAYNLEQCSVFSQTSYNIAGHCLLIAGEIDRARNMFNMSLQTKFLKKNSAMWYKKNFCSLAR